MVSGLLARLNARLSRASITGAFCVGIQNGMSVLADRFSGSRSTPDDTGAQRARMSMACRRAYARRVKSIGCDGLLRVNVTVTGLYVPGGNDGTVTFALTAFVTPSACRPTPAVDASTVTLPGPAVTASNPPLLPGNTSVTVSVGVQTPGTGGVGVGTGVPVGVGVGVGGSPVHCARISTALCRADARSVKSTGCPGFGIVNVAVTGLYVPRGNDGIVTFAFVALTTV